MSKLEMGDVRPNTSKATDEVFFFDVKLVLLIIYYLLVLILGIELYTVKVSIKS